MTAPHGAAAWIAWGAGIAAPLASVLVAFVAVRVSRASERRSVAAARARSFGRASLLRFDVDKSHGLVRSIPGRGPSINYLYRVQVHNGGDDPMYRLVVRPLVGDSWRGRKIMSDLWERVIDLAARQARGYRLAPGAQQAFTVGLRLYLPTDRPEQAGELAPEFGRDLRWVATWIDVDGQWWQVEQNERPVRIESPHNDEG